MQQEKLAIENVLDELHRAAAKPDFAAYFRKFSPDAVFIGTDAKERWSIEEFQAYAKPFFSQGKGWTYVPKSSTIQFSPSTDVAWFDEILHNEKYGTCRGTGVLIRADSQWKIAQYHLTIPIPNDLADPFAKIIKSLENSPSSR